MLFALRIHTGLIGLDEPFDAAPNSTADHGRAMDRPVDDGPFDTEIVIPTSQQHAWSLVSAAEVNLSDKPGRFVQEDLERYYYLLEEALSQVTLTESEAWLIRHLCLGWWVTTPSDAQGLWQEVEDALAAGADLFTDWNENGEGQQLIDKLKGLTNVQAMAVVHAAQRVPAAPPETPRRAVLALVKSVAPSRTPARKRTLRSRG